MIVLHAKRRRASFSVTSPQVYRAAFAAALACAAALPVLAGQTAKRPPTLDPTYGMRPPRAQSPNAPARPDAQWIWADTTADNQTVGMRGRLDVAAPPRSALVYVTADDFFTLYINGKQTDQSVPDPKDNNVWQRVHRVDIAGMLHAGANTIALKAFNAGGAAGAIVRVEIDGKPALLTDGQWKARAQNAQNDQNLPAGWTEAAFNDSGWKNARVIAPLQGDPWASVGGLNGWPGYDASAPYLAHLRLAPTALLSPQSGGGRITIDDNSADTFTVTLPASTTGAAPGLVVDFGQEIAGRVEITGIEGAGKGRGRQAGQETGGEASKEAGQGTSGTVGVMVGTGESQEEAVKSPWGGAHRLDIASGKTAYSPYSAFRYAHLTFPALAGGASGAGGPVRMRVAVDHKYYPVEYKGAFTCSDDLLTRIWYTGAYTSHLCMQEDIWDAPKRDRARWIGDLHVSGAVINLAFADRFLMEQTMQRLRDEAQGGQPATAPPRAHVNGIPGYSCAWICTLADFHRHIGDYEYLNKQHDGLISLLDYLQGELDGRGVFANLRKAWPFVDWAPDFNKDGPRARAATHLFLVKAAREAVFLLFEMGDEANAKKYDSWAESLSEAAQRNLADPRTNTFSDRRQDNAMAIYAGVADKAQTQAIYDTILKPTSPAWQMIATPYYNNYVIYAMSQAGHTPETLDVIRKYWGGMLAQGATSWWEGYDPRWEKTDFHAHLQADDSTGYFVSLAHGWSAGPTSWLTERILGVRPTAGGFKTVDIVPELGDLQWAEGDVPTPQGNMHVRVDKQTNGISLNVRVPRGVKATLTVPGNTIYVQGPKNATIASPDQPLPKPL